MDQKDFEGSVNPVDFHQYVCINTLAPDPEFWPKAEALIKQARAEYRTPMAMSVVEESSDFDLQKKAAEFAVSTLEVTSDTVDEVASSIIQKIRECANGEELEIALKPALLDLYKWARLMPGDGERLLIKYDCDM